MLVILLIDIHPRKVIPNKNNKNHPNRAHRKAELENTKSEPNSITKASSTYQQRLLDKDQKETQERKLHCCQDGEETGYTDDPYATQV